MVPLGLSHSALRKIPNFCAPYSILFAPRPKPFVQNPILMGSFPPYWLLFRNTHQPSLSKLFCKALPHPLLLLLLPAHLHTGKTPGRFRAGSLNLVKALGYICCFYDRSASLCRAARVPGRGDNPPTPHPLPPQASVPLTAGTSSASSCGVVTQRFKATTTKPEQGEGKVEAMQNTARGTCAASPLSMAVANAPSASRHKPMRAYVRRSLRVGPLTLSWEPTWESNAGWTGQGVGVFWGSNLRRAL